MVMAMLVLSGGDLELGVCLGETINTNWCSLSLLWDSNVVMMELWLHNVWNNNGFEIKSFPASYIHSKQIHQTHFF